MINAIFSILDFLVNLLPLSPFRKVEIGISQYDWLRFMNWVIPIDVFIIILDFYLAAVIAFLIWSQRHSYTKLIKNLITKFFNLFEKK